MIGTILQLLGELRRALRHGELDLRPKRCPLGACASVSDRDSLFTGYAQHSMSAFEQPIVAPAQSWMKSAPDVAAEAAPKAAVTCAKRQHARLGNAPQDAALARLLAEAVTQRAGGSAFAQHPSSEVLRGPLLQRLTIPEALNAAVARGGVDGRWYNTTCIPAMTTVAARAGIGLQQYLTALNEQQFLQVVNALRQGIRIEPPPSMFGQMLASFSTPQQVQGLAITDSSAYPGMKRVQGTNVLIHPQALSGGVTNEIQTFVADYLAGRLEWFRGMNITHFAWPALELYGTLASEGTTDAPTFTMGNAQPTRWLPGLYVRDGNCNAPAFTIDRAATGMRDVVARVEVPVGAVLKYAVNPPTPVAYLNDGEQVVRGPLLGAQLEVDGVYLYGPLGLRETAGGTRPTDLPPAAPYNAAVNSAAMNNWEAVAVPWALNHP